MTSELTPDVLVLGAGLAGLSAAIALGQAGSRVTLLERRPDIGGRAYSYLHPALEETVDSQHVVLGCCTNILDLCEQAGAGQHLRWYDTLTFLEASGRRSVLTPSPLPAPFHQTLSFLRVPMLSLRDKAAIAAGLVRFLRGYPQRDDQSFADWLKQTNQTPRAIRHFWEPVLLGALNDTFDRCSTRYAAQVFHESFLRSPQGGRLGIPALPLTEFFAPLSALAYAHGVRTHLRTGADTLRPTSAGTWQVLSGDRTFTAPTVLLALDFKQTAALLAPLPGLPPQPSLSPFVAAPITTVHLWFDRDVSDLDHAVLLDTRIQWMFNKSRIRRWHPSRGSYLEFVISASWPELKLSRESILASALAEAELFFPRIREARLLKSAVLKEARATFSVTPGLDRLRPASSTALPGLFLAGDWTRTGWPSTMEGAVRSGRLAAGAIHGDSLKFLAPELPPSGLMRWLAPNLPAFRL